MTYPVTGLGRCTLVVDERKELLCNKPGVAEILVRNKFGLFVATLCDGCEQRHRRFYEELHAHRRRNQPATPNQGESDAGHFRQSTKGGQLRQMSSVSN